MIPKRRTLKGNNNLLKQALKDLRAHRIESLTLASFKQCIKKMSQNH